MQIKLTGWQRLWVIISIVWLIFYAVIVLNNWQFADSIRAEWVTEISNLFGRYNGDNIGSSKIRGKYFSDFGDNRQLIEKAKRVFESRWTQYNMAKNSKLDTEGTKSWNEFQSSFPNLTARYEEFYKDFIQLEKTYGRQMEAPVIISRIGILFGIWLLSIAALYGLGWAIGWVYRGFRTSK